MKTYLVTVTDKKYLENLYEEMEVEGKSPSSCDISRSVECSLKRPISRTTEYILSEEEAIELLKCEYVASIEEKNDFEVSVDFGEFDITSSLWKKNATTGTNNELQNWALMRMSTESRPDYANWGRDGVADIDGTVTRTLTGKNVDIIIHETYDNIYQDHPEFLDKNGNSRVQRYDWYQHKQEVEGEPQTNSYDYDTSNARARHVTPVASAAAGLNYSFAPEANIYSLATSKINPPIAIDYIRAFHANKPNNPETGRPNPTIVNCSFGFGRWISLSKIYRVLRQGAVSQQNPGDYYTRPELLNFGVFQDPSLRFSDIGGAALLPASNLNQDFYKGTSIYQGTLQSARISSIADAMGEGIIFVCASGNQNGLTSKPTDPDYNTIVFTEEIISNVTGNWTPAPVQLQSFYANRGTFPALTNELIPYNIIIGATDSTVEEKRAHFSNFGPGITAYAPGATVLSAVDLDDLEGIVHPDNTDPNRDYLIGLASGTSFSCPMVTGMLAAALEVYPYWSQKEAYEYIIGTSLENTLSDTTDINDPDQKYLFGPNRQAFRKIEKSNSGNVFPQNNLNVRKESGVVYPRTRIKRNKTVNKKLPYISSISYSGHFALETTGDYAGTPLARRNGTSFNIIVSGSNIPDETVLYWNIIDSDGNPGLGYVTNDSGTVQVVSNQATINILIPDIPDTKLMKFLISFYEKEQYDFNTYQQTFYAYYV